MVQGKQTIQGLAVLVSLLLLIGWRSSEPAEPEPLSTPSSVRVAPQDRQYGVSWVGGHEIKGPELEPIQTLGVNWMVQTPFGWQEGLTSPRVHLASSGHLWGETDEGLIKTAELAHAAGIHILLKPHIWLSQAPEGKWCSDIAMTSESDWQAWWTDYGDFIRHYAELARDHQMEGLCIGTELLGTMGHESQWRQLIKEVRAIYPGRLTYAANWYQEYEKVPFWDALDYIGIQAYFPLTQNPNPSLADLVAGWQPYVTSIGKVAEASHKPVIFTEIGYRADSLAAKEPWTWPKRGEQATPEGLQNQATCYEAFFQGVWSQPWMAGAYIWKWHPHRSYENPLSGSDFSPQGKPAERVLAHYYSKKASPSQGR